MSWVSSLVEPVLVESVLEVHKEGSLMVIVLALSALEFQVLVEWRVDVAAVARWTDRAGRRRMYRTKRASDLHITFARGR
jgi:hypothetical protein